MKKLIIWKNKLLLLSILTLLVSCEITNNNQDDNAEKAVFSLRLTDAPGNFEEVLSDIKEINVHSELEGWLSLDSGNLGVFNLLDFTNDHDTLLFENELNTGTLSQMRLVLGDSNYVKVNGEYHKIKTPSAQTSGLKFNIHADLTAGITYKMWIDFDANKSVILQGNGNYQLKPVIRTYTEATSGGINGYLVPRNIQTYVSAISLANDTVGTISDTISGEYFIKGLNEGNYSMTFESDTTYQTISIDAVQVTTGNITTLDTVFMVPK